MERSIRSLCAWALGLGPALLLGSSAHAFYAEVRGADSEAGVDRPVRYADGDPSTPDTIEVSYRVNGATFPAGVEGVGEAIDAAFASWSEAGCGNLRFVAGTPSDATDRAHWINDMGAIYVLVYFSSDTRDWVSSPQSVGNFYWAHDGTGRLIGGSVVLNSAAHAWATDGNLDVLDVQSIVTALIGRSLGITSGMEGNATFPRYAPGDVGKRSLGADDLDAVHFLYPSSATGCDALPTPDAECREIDGPMDPPCPPPVMTNPGDGGTRPTVDAGPPSGSDAGMMLPDGGGPMAEGCTCRAAAPRSTGSRPFTIAFLALAMVALRHGGRRARTSSRAR
ncbi:MAG: hypothetical protein AB7S26_22370 [Sandaracinaceae bacterium]